MAKMQGIHASLIRGSIGGNTFFSGPNNAILIRQRTAPVNPNSNRQSQIRGAFGDASTMWLALSDADRTAWNDYAANLVYSGPLGNYHCTGRQVFLSNLSIAKYLDDRGIDVDTVAGDPPVIPGFLGLSDFDVIPLAAPGDGYSIQFSNPNSESIVAYVQRSVAFNPTRNSYKGPWVEASLTSAEIVSLGSADIPFTGLAPDYVYFNVIRAITAEPPYRISAQFIVRAVAETTAV